MTYAEMGYALSQYVQAVIGACFLAVLAVVLRTYWRGL